MAIAAGSVVGPYEVLTLTGAGGMGEVYRARDPRLGRDVALKILPERFALDAERLARFRREAQLLASLNHPNIATIHGIEEAGGQLVLVLELVDGVTLSDRLTGGRLPLGDTIHIARQLIEGLAAAHDSGVVHRDLKPANVMVRADGTVKILDFGLAKALDPTEGAAADAATMTASISRVGAVFGTAIYMSPEQAQGRAVDKRTDIWAFGCVLYEMLTGTRAFTGDTAVETLAYILTREPDWSALPADASPSLIALLRRCLSKDRRRRLADIADARFDLEEPREAPRVGSRAGDGTRRPRVREAIAWSLVLLCGALAVWALTKARRSSDPAAVVRFAIPLPPSSSMVQGFAMAPQGRRLAFVAPDSSGDNVVWVQSLDQVEPTRLPGTEGAYSPFWSPDGSSIAFFAQGKLKKTAGAVGTVQTLCEVVSPATEPAGTWGTRGIILFAQTFGPISRISADGGEAAPATAVDAGRKEFGHYNPVFLPDGDHFLFDNGASPENSGVYVGSLTSGQKTPLLGRRVQAFAVGADGHLLFVDQGLLQVQKVDFDKLQLIGSSVPLFDGVNRLSPANDGTLAYSGVGASQTQLTWFDRTGRRLGTVGRPGHYIAPALSPDESKVAVSRDGDIWVRDLVRGWETRITSEPDSENFPTWSADGDSLLYTRGAANAVTGGTLLRKPASGAGKEELLLDEENVIPYEVSSDGHVMSYMSSHRETLGDLFLLSLSDHQSRVLVHTPRHEKEGRLSPNGRWLAYTSQESNGLAVFVQPDSRPDKRSQISTTAGSQPLWRRDGNELFYITANGALTAVDIKTTPAFHAGVPHALFKVNVPLGAVRNSYVPSRDGARFLVNSYVDERPAAISVILNWPAMGSW